MGEYFHIVCHDCRKFHAPSSLKLREIALNPESAAEVGWFATLHAGHHLELRGDEYNRSIHDDNGYMPETFDGDSDIAEAQSTLLRWKAAAHRRPQQPLPQPQDDTPGAGEAK